MIKKSYYHNPKTIIITILIIVLCTSIVSAGYNIPSNYKGLSGISKGKPKFKTTIVVITKTQKTSDKMILKNKAISILGSSGSNKLTTRTEFLKAFKIEKKYGALN